MVKDLNISRMPANGHLSRAIADVGFYEIRRQPQYNTQHDGTRIMLADRRYSSSKLCSGCSTRNGRLTLGERT